MKVGLGKNWNPIEIVGSKKLGLVCDIKQGVRVLYVPNDALPKLIAALQKIEKKVNA